MAAAVPIVLGVTAAAGTAMAIKSLTTKPPSAPAAPTTPTATDPAALQAAQQQQLSLATAAGQGSTILTGGMGVTTAPTLGKKVLLGG